MGVRLPPVHWGLQDSGALGQNGVRSFAGLPAEGWHRVSSPRARSVTTSSYRVGWEPSWQTIKEKREVPVFYASNNPVIKRGHLNK